MSNLTKDELGFIRVSHYGRMSRKELEDWMELQPGEAVYHSGVKRGVRVSEPVKGQDVKLKPGDTLSVGPVITKAASSGEPEWLGRERQALSRAGYGGVGKSVRTQWGWALLLKGLTLPGGVRTEALVLLPKDYPRMSPVGFYIRDRAAQGGLDLGQEVRLEAQTADQRLGHQALIV